MKRLDHPTAAALATAPAFRGRGRALTLIELLAMIVIISMAAGVVMVNLSSMSDSAAFRAGAAAVRDLDARGRLSGRTGAPAALMATMEHDGLILRSQAPGEAIGHASMPSGMTVHLRTVDSGDMSIRFDAFGRSADYDIILRRGERLVIWRIAGLTGCVVEKGGPS
jgi:competence protein ComGC